jgi:hypothetical protein
MADPLLVNSGDIGLIGLGVMGRNFALNTAEDPRALCEKLRRPRGDPDAGAGRRARGRGDPLPRAPSAGR